MTQSTILAAAQTAAVSSTQTVAAGAIQTVGLFTASGSIPSLAAAEVQYVTPGANVNFATISGENPFVQVQGPCSFQVSRYDVSKWGTNIGVFVES